jgi:hypothetical protein
MLPGKVLSDNDDGKEAHAYYAGRWTLLSDLQREFGGLFGAYLFLAFLFPGALIASVFFEWVERPGMTLVFAATLFVALLSISLFSLAWYRWAKKREQRAFEMMQQKGREELELEEQSRAQGLLTTRPPSL